MEKSKRFNSAWLAITYDCNNKCVWCYADSPSQEMKRKRMDQETLDYSRNLLTDLGIEKITLIGGEPTMFPGLGHLISSSKSRGFNVGMVSNGRRFSQNSFARDIQASGLDRLTISIEGSNSSVHESITKIPGSFEESIRGIRNCLDLGMNVSTESTVSYLNKEDLDSLAGFLKSLGVGSAAFNICGPCLTSEHGFTVRPRDSAGLLGKIYKTSKREGLKMNIVTPQPLCNFDEGLAEEMLASDSLNTHCYSFYGKGFVIDYNADILPCVHYHGFPFFNLRKNGRFLKKEDFLKEYFEKGTSAEKFRERLWTYPSVKCVGDADYGKKCLGGCPLFWFKFNPEEEIKGKCHF